MHSILVKKYPLIGVRATIPTPSALTPITGIELTSPTAVDIAEGMEVTNSRSKLAVVFTNTDDTVDLVVTPVVTATVYTYAVESPSITIAPGETWIIGPFSANFESASKVQFNFTGVSGTCQAIRLP